MAKPRVYLGSIAIVPRKDIKRSVENFPSDSDPVLEAAFHQKLCEVFALPPPPPVDSLLKTDLCIDIDLMGYNVGEAIDFHFGDFGFPLIWRPKIELRARLRNLSKQKTIKKFSITERPSWRECLSAALSWRSPFARQGALDDRSMQVLLNRASLRLLERIAAVAYR